MAAKLAGMLKIKPILEVSKNTEGKVDVFDKVRTMSKAIKKAVKVISKDAECTRLWILCIKRRKSRRYTKLR